ncbi:MAG TPA: glycosyltransferase family 9 protein [Dictyobacter sp.]|jgi:ADP-heptose:LPS heptosyltransferase|nr:glycosyltransferase family 9 protein [Dictyobacter sp.]
MKKALRTSILALVRILGTPGAQQARRHATQLHEPLRILLIRPDHLGDLIMVTPVLQAIKDQLPTAHITMMVGPWSREVVARQPAVDDLLICPFPGFQRAAQNPLTPYTLLVQTAQQLRQGQYDIAINLRPDFWWGAALLYLARVPLRIGYAIEPGTPFLTHALPFPSMPEHATVSNLWLVSAGLQASGHTPLTEPFDPEHYPLTFVPTDAERLWVQQRLTQAGITAEKPLVVIHAGTGGAVKLWRMDGWATIADQLLDTQLLPPSTQIILTGGKQEQALVDEIARHMTHQPVILTDMTIGQMAALLKRAQLVLGVDNGPLHFAAAQNTPSLRLFGPTDTRIFGPWGTATRHRVLAATHPCAGCPFIPCGRLDFSAEELPDHPCVRNISNHQMIEAVSALIKMVPIDISPG